jgi:hypothetical protein
LTPVRTTNGATPQIIGTTVILAVMLAVRAAVVRVRWMDQVTVRMLPGIGRQNRPAE